MKKALIVALALAVLPGCAIYMSPKWSGTLDQTAAYSAAVADVAEEENVTKESCIRELRKQAQMWEQFRRAKDESMKMPWED